MIGHWQKAKASRVDTGLSIHKKENIYAIRIYLQKYTQCAF